MVSSCTIAITSSSVSSAASSVTSSSLSYTGGTLPNPSVSSSAPPSPSGSSSDSRAIAGGVVGGVTAIASALLISIWYFRKRKSNARSKRSYLGDGSRSFYEKNALSHAPGASPYEKDATSHAPGVKEADSVAKYELLASKQPTPAIELQDTSK